MLRIIRTMNTQYPDNPTRRFWLTGTITLFGENDDQAMFQIDEVCGANLAIQRQYKNSVAEFSGAFPEAVEFSVDTKKCRLNFNLKKKAGHKFASGLEIGAFVAFYKEKEEQRDLGLSIIAWNLKHVFEKAAEEARALAAKKVTELEQDAQRILNEKETVYWVHEQGGSGKPLTTQRLRHLADFFEHRAWPKGLVWVKLVGNKKQQVDEPPMIPAPGYPPGCGHIVTPWKRPDFIKNPRLETLYETVKDQPIQYELRAIPVKEMTINDMLIEVAREFGPIRTEAAEEPAKPLVDLSGAFAGLDLEKVVAAKVPEPEAVPAKKEGPKGGPSSAASPTRSERRNGKPKKNKAAADKVTC